MVLFLNEIQVEKRLRIYCRIELNNIKRLYDIDWITYNKKSLKQSAEGAGKEIKRHSRI